MSTDGVPVSFEIHPPRGARRAAEAWSAIQELAAGGPDFISVTTGPPGASPAGSRTLLRRLMTETGARPVAHLTCAGTTRADMAALVGELLADGVRQFVALRGDLPAGQVRWAPPADGLRDSSELVALIHEVAAGARTRQGPLAEPVTVAVAAHPPAPGRSLTADVTSLAAKERAGADLALTQYFFDAPDYLALVAAARAAGVGMPVVPGIVPLTDPGRLTRLATLTGVPLPGWVQHVLDVPDPAERLQRGTRATLRLVEELLDAGAPGIHVYTLNQAQPALDILRAVRAGAAGGRPRG